MNALTEAITAMRQLKAAGVINEYAIGGAMALMFWSEPIPTFDLDVFVLLPSENSLVSLNPIYEWARQNGYREEAEHIFIAGIPVQVIPAHNALAEEAITTAAELDFEGQSIRVMRPEYCHDMSSRAEKGGSGKQKLRKFRRKLSLLEKLAQVVELQMIVLPLIQRRRALRPWERVWNLATSSR